jgi:hypothetical protein
MRHDQFTDLADELDRAATASPVAITITAPTHRHAPDNQQDPIRVRRLARAARTQLDQLELSRDDRRTLTGRLDRLEADIDTQLGWRNTDLGVACYLTVGLTRIVTLAHRPPERAIIADQFSLATPLADLVTADDVDVLILSTGGNATDGARLVRLTRGELVEVATAEFPLSYDVRDRNRAYADRIESDRRDAHIENFLRRVNAAYLSVRDTDGDRDLVVVGIDRLRHHWHKISPSRLTGAVVAELASNVDRHTPAQLAALITTTVDSARTSRALAAVDQLAAAGPHRTVTIADDIHRLGRDGRLHRLLVEEGATDEVTVDGVILGDRIATTLRRCWQAGTDIVIVPPGALAAYNGIAGLARW